MQFPELSTDRLKLNQITSDDADSIYELFSNPKVVEYYDFDVFTETDQSQHFIKQMQDRFGKFCIICPVLDL